MAYKVLFIFHEDSQSGAPNALLTFLKFLKETHAKDLLVDIYVMNPFGELEQQLNEVSSNFYKKSKKKTFFGKMFKALQSDIHDLVKKNKYDMIYGNTIVTLDLLSEIKNKNAQSKTFIHVHESQFLCSQFLDQNKAIKQFQNVDHILAVSKLSGNNLIENYKVSADKIFIIPPTIKEEEFIVDTTIKDSYKDFDLVLVTIGHPNLTKGSDLLPQIANVLRERNPNLKFKILLIGVRYDNDYLKAIKLDIQKLGLDNHIELIPHSSQPLSYMKVANVYLIPSREDSFSLMSLQAVISDKPVVTFKDAIGSSEIFGESGFFEANYLNINDFVYQIEEIHTKPKLALEKVALAKRIYNESLNFQEVNEKHFQTLMKLLNR